MQYLTAAETAERLGVKRETVYAYVSRGLLTSVRSAERRGSRFAEDEVERLAARGRESDPPSGAVERIRTAISLLSDDGLCYRGVRAASLPSLEETAGLLWETDPPDLLPDPGRERIARAAIAALPPGTRLTDRIRLAVAAQAAVDPLRADVSEPAVVRTAASLLGTTVAALAPTGSAAPPAVPHPSPARRTGRSGCDTPTRGATASGEGIAGILWPALLRDPGRAGDPPPAFGAALVLLADHGLAASTVAARVAASTRADVYAVVSAGLGALDGRDHGLVSGLAHRLLGDARADPVGVLAERLRAGERVPGFGHAVYTRPDPRAARLFALLRDDPPAADVLSTVDALVDGMARGGASWPNVDLALAALMHAFDLRSDAGEAIFAVARTVGWVAHALEEYREPGLRFRPVGVYVGPRPG
ncbi:citrate synthase [Pseudonocardia endophytica]|uniref:citrate synthase (unknown stereospecificity) n=1 Tax=Pseudonocardia endophytica TaxID=401976 RepID=A0A4V2PIU7_PSEEN|nr:citrate synthase [Pseudonocardia endophytica]TCK26046.1 citrate synthase [Pseudonocardia endophytica]